MHVEAHQTGGSEDERGVGTVGRVELGEARVDVAANVAEDQVRVSPSQLGYAADGGGADDRADGQLVEHLVRQAGLDHEGIARILALKYGGKFETLGQSGGDVLETVYDGIDGALLESDLELLGPDGLAFATDDVQRRAQVLVTGGGHGGDGEGVWAQWSVGCGWKEWRRLRRKSTSWSAWSLSTFWRRVAGVAEGDEDPAGLLPGESTESAAVAWSSWVRKRGEDLP